MKLHTNDQIETEKASIPSAAQPRICASCEASAVMDARDGKAATHIFFCAHESSIPQIGVLGFGYARSGVIASWQIVGPGLAAELYAMANSYMDRAAAAGIHTERMTPNSGN